MSQSNIKIPYNFLNPIPFSREFLFLPAVGIKPRVLNKLSKSSTTELYPQPPNTFLKIVQSDLIWHHLESLLEMHIPDLYPNQWNTNFLGVRLKTAFLSVSTPHESSILSYNVLQSLSNCIGWLLFIYQAYKNLGWCLTWCF